VLGLDFREGLSHRIDWAGRNPCSFELLEPVRCRLPSDRFANQPDDFRPTGDARRVRREARVARPPGIPTDFCKPRELAVVPDRDDDWPVGGLERLVGDEVRMRVPLPWRV